MTAEVAGAGGHADGTDRPIRVVVAGEALVDLVPEGEALVPHPGGSPFNVAVGLGRLGAATAFLGPLSEDGFGRLLVDRLTGAQVDVGSAPRVEAPTTLAVVHVDTDHRATYGFYLDATSAATASADQLPDLPDGAALHVSFGAIGVTHEPTGVALTTLLRREAGRRFTSLDPNVRPTAIDDADAWRRELEATVAVVDLVKVSDDDLAELYPDEDADHVAIRWAASGPVLVVVTRGPDGAVAFGPGGRVEVPGIDVAVIDTVGAGDAFTAGLLAHLVATGGASRDALTGASPLTVGAAVEQAVLVAASTCTRPGADPPTAAQLADELAAGLASGRDGR